MIRAVESQIIPQTIGARRKFRIRDWQLGALKALSYAVIRRLARYS